MDELPADGTREGRPMSGHTEQFVLDLAVGGFVEPIGRKGRYVTSRLAILADGSPMPVLELLAQQKFAEREPEQFAFWIDGDYRNEVLSNVNLATRQTPQAALRTR